MEQKPTATPALWNKTTSIQGRLREPKIKTSASIQKTSNNATVLRPDAPEFVPAWMKPNTNEIEQQFQNVHITVDDPPLQHTPSQDRLNKYKTSSQNSKNNTSSLPSSSELSNGYCENDSMDMIRLKQIIASLIQYPGQFDDLLIVFMETIYPYLGDIRVMSEVANLLVEQAINCPNFCYNGVRLCWYIEQECPTFRAELHLRCQKELMETHSLQNVVLFIAELYTQLPHDSLYGALLIESLTKLLTVGGNENIKCVCQALKLTGYSLEQNHKEALDDLFLHLTSFKSSLTGSALILLNSVINLRECNWGRTSTESSNSDASDYDHDCEEIVNGILYETDGQEILTNEEQEFLVANATHNDYEIDNEDPDALCDPEPEMDEEIQAAFEEFVRLSKG